MGLDSRKKLERAVWTAAFVLSVFIGFPALSMQINDWLDWPHWAFLPARAVGIVLMGGGIATYIYCRRLFWRIGHGTTSPFAPPENLVGVGLYKYSRNPIYVAYVAYFLGLFLFFGHIALLAYLTASGLFIFVFAHRWEEPGLRARFGDDYVRYCSKVPRWFGAPQAEHKSTT